jgi:Fe2+ transport system protein FeoA
MMRRFRPRPRPDRSLNPAVPGAPLPLTEVAEAEEWLVIRITSTDPGKLDRLGAYGIVPGTWIRLVQRRPAFIVQVGETELAFDGDLARAILVNKG